MCPGVVRLWLRERWVRWEKCGNAAASDCIEGIEMSQLSSTKELKRGWFRRRCGTREGMALWRLRGGPRGLRRLCVTTVFLHAIFESSARPCRGGGSPERSSSRLHGTRASTCFATSGGSFWSTYTAAQRTVRHY